ncbi:hypothetical protein, partial [Streptomyces sp. SolWspMP-sol7th]|uniref:hypothetical protein n=1 Tax=Streptomyces sp. SolWspMP-sol7th TaxID=1839776 RepID=UPI0020C82CE5
MHHRTHDERTITEDEMTQTKTKKASGTTSKKSASAAGKTVGGKAKTASGKKAAGSALAQKGSGKKATRSGSASAAGKTVAASKPTKAEKKAAASALSPGPGDEEETGQEGPHRRREDPRGPQGDQEGPLRGGGHAGPRGGGSDALTRPATARAPASVGPGAGASWGDRRTGATPRCARGAP